MLVKRIDEVPAAPVAMAGAKDVQVRVIFGPKDNAPTFAMRQFELRPGGCTPHHSHPYEHEIIVLQGELILTAPQGTQPLTVGDAVMVNANEKHQFQNPSTQTAAKMICLIPAEYQK